MCRERAHVSCTRRSVRLTSNLHFHVSHCLAGSGAAVAFERAATLFTEELKDEDNAEDQACSNFTEAARCYKRFRADSAYKRARRFLCE